MKRRIAALLLACMTAMAAGACSGEEATQEGSAEETQNEEPQDTGTQDAETQDTEAQDAGAQDGGAGGTLVAYFTYAENAELPEGIDASSSASIQSWNGEVTGNTGAVARMISEETGGELFSIRTVEKYPDNYDDTIDQGQEEQREEARPQLETHIGNQEEYDTVFLGYPNWWGDMPMAVYSFLEEYDLTGKTVIPFVTSGGSGFSDTVSRIGELQPGADVQEGIAVSASGAMDAREEIRSWLDGLG
nr:flavodoxin [uncultured Lachnoclostridium sp.]